MLLNSCSKNPSRGGEESLIKVLENLSSFIVSVIIGSFAIKLLTGLSYMIES